MDASTNFWDVASHKKNNCCLTSGSSRVDAALHGGYYAGCMVGIKGTSDADSRKILHALCFSGSNSGYDCIVIGFTRTSDVMCEEIKPVFRNKEPDNSYVRVCGLTNLNLTVDCERYDMNFVNAVEHEEMVTGKKYPVVFVEDVDNLASSVTFPNDYGGQPKVVHNIEKVLDKLRNWTSRTGRVIVFSISSKYNENMLKKYAYMFKSFRTPDKHLTFELYA